MKECSGLFERVKSKTNITVGGKYTENIPLGSLEDGGESTWKLHFRAGKILTSNWLALENFSISWFKNARYRSNVTDEKLIW